MIWVNVVCLVAVVGDHTWAAQRGLAALAITWDEGPHAGVDTAQVFARLRAASTRPGVVGKSVGDVGKALSRDAVEATYEVPFLAHAPMEPLNCTVHVTPGGCEVWRLRLAIGKVAVDTPPPLQQRQGRRRQGSREPSRATRLLETRPTCRRPPPGAPSLAARRCRADRVPPRRPCSRPIEADAGAR